MLYRAARVAKLADARDLKSRVPKGTCRFNSGPGHHVCRFPNARSCSHKQLGSPPCIERVNKAHPERPMPRPASAIACIRMCQVLQALRRDSIDSEYDERERLECPLAEREFEQCGEEPSVSDLLAPTADYFRGFARRKSPFASTRRLLPPNHSVELLQILDTPPAETHENAFDSE
jgi:hypothetical protein